MNPWSTCINSKRQAQVRTWYLVSFWEEKTIVTRILKNGEPANNVGGDGNAGNLLSQEIDDAAEVIAGVLPFHVPQHGVAAALDGHVQELVHAGVPHDFGDFVQVVQDVGRVGHSKSQPTIFRHNLDKFTK